MKTKLDHTCGSNIEHSSNNNTFNHMNKYFTYESEIREERQSKLFLG